MVNKNELLQLLPPFSNRAITIRKNQTVADIVKEVLQAHEVFAPDYDAIAVGFDRGNNLETAKELFRFLKQNVRYKVEPEEKQTTKSPAAILVTATGDCKHYAGFIAGVLDALARQGRRIDWHYRFASYNLFDSIPGHVFVVMNEGGEEIWIDPVLKTFNERLEPTYILDKKPKAMLQRVSGIGYTVEPTDFSSHIYTEAQGVQLAKEVAALPLEEVYQVAMETGDESIPPEITKAIAVLIKYGVMDSMGRVNDDLLAHLSETLPVNEWEEVANARIAIHTAAINGFFGDVWNGIKSAGSWLWGATKKVTLAVPRNAYLGLVALNVFGFATKLWNAIHNADGSYYTTGRDKVKSKWESLGGGWSHLEGAINSGHKKKAILGEVDAIGNPAAAAPAWVAAASVIIAAMTPLILGLLKGKQQEMPNMYPYGVCDDGFTPRNADGTCTAFPGAGNNSGGGVMDFIQNNPLLVVGVGAAAAYFITKPKNK